VRCAAKGLLFPDAVRSGAFLIYPVKLAEIIRSALAMSKTPLALPAAAAAPPAIDLDTAQLDQIIGAKGAANGGVYQFNVPRRDPITEGGMMVGMPATGGQSGRTSLPGRRLLQPFDQHR
jgi:hypothetical protein